MSLTSLLRRADKPDESQYGDQPKGLTLRDVVLLDVAVGWQEAVALVRETLSAIAAPDGFPDPATITLSPIGELHQTASRALPGHPVKRAVGFLKELLRASPSPPALRALIDDDFTDRPTHPTLDDLARALEYFERPNRRADVAAIYSRAQAVYVKSVADQELEKLRAKVVRENDTPQLRVTFLDRWRGPVLRAALIVALCGVIGVSGYTLVHMAFEEDPATDDAGNPVPEKPLSETIGTAGTRVRDIVERSVATGLSMAGLPVPGKTAPAPPPATSEPQARPSRARSRTDGAAASDGGWSVSVRDVTATYLADQAAAAAPPAPAATADNLAPAADQRNGPLFSSVDAEVDPATLIRPQLPSQARDAVIASHGVGVLELIVDERGTVERVQLTSDRNRLNDKMLVAAAKAWIFEPARLNGSPVRYQLRIHITE